MTIRKRRVRAGLVSAAVLLSSAGLGLTTSTPAVADGACFVFGVPYDDGKKVRATNSCSGDARETLYRKFAWKNGSDSFCVSFRPFQSYTHTRPNPFATFEDMKAC